MQIEKLSGLKILKHLLEKFNRKVKMRFAKIVRREGSKVFEDCIRSKNPNTSNYCRVRQTARKTEEYKARTTKLKVTLAYNCKFVFTVLLVISRDRTRSLFTTT